MTHQQLQEASFKTEKRPSVINATGFSIAKIEAIVGQDTDISYCP